MMTFAWTFQWILSDAEERPTANEYTMEYVAQLARQLTPKQSLYAEIRWRDPLG